MIYEFPGAGGELLRIDLSGGRFWPDFYEVVGSARYPGYYALRARITGAVYDYGFLGVQDARVAARGLTSQGGADTTIPTDVRDRLSID